VTRPTIKVIMPAKIAHDGDVAGMRAVNAKFQQSSRSQSSQSGDLAGWIGT
jgi:hypothetical protein